MNDELEIPSFLDRRANKKDGDKAKYTLRKPDKLPRKRGAKSNITSTCGGGV